MANRCPHFEETDSKPGVATLAFYCICRVRHLYFSLLLRGPMKRHGNVFLTSLVAVALRPKRQPADPVFRDTFHFERKYEGWAWLPQSDNDHITHLAVICL